MQMLYQVKDRPSVGRLIVFALQQLLAIIAGTITLPLIVGNGLSQSAALFGASIGTLVYLAITKFKSPVFLGSSFTYLGSMFSAFAGAATAAIGYFGVILGAILAGLVYVILSIIVKKTGTNWVSKVMPPVIIGPIVILIGLTLAPNAIANIYSGNVLQDGVPVASPLVCIAVGLITLFVIVIIATHSRGFMKLIPLIVGVFVGYIIAAILTVIGNATGADAIKIINFTPFENIRWVPDFSFLHLGQAFKDFSETGSFWKYFGTIALLYVPLAFAVFAEHIADHKNLSFIIQKDLLEDPGLHRTLLGDGVGSMVGAFFGGCPNTTYGESISCVAFSKNSSIITIVVTSCLGMAISFFGPLMTFFETIPNCIVGGLSIALYGYIASSGLRMLKDVNLNDQRNIFIVSSILVTGIGGMIIYLYGFELPTIACSLLVGILVNVITHVSPKKKVPVEPDTKNIDEEK